MAAEEAWVGVGTGVGVAVGVVGISFRGINPPKAKDTPNAKRNKAEMAPATCSFFMLKQQCNSKLIS